MADELEEAAAKGRAERAVADEKLARYRARSAEAERVEADRRYWASVSRWGIFRVSGMGFYYLFLLFLFLLAPLNIMILVWLRPPEWLFHVLVPGRGRLYLPIPAALIAIAIWYYAAFACRRAVARERAFIASLPFAVTGWEERLGVYPSRGKDLAFTLAFVDKAPGAELVRDVLSSDGGKWEFDEAKGRAVRGRIETFWARSTNHNRPEVRWFHALAGNQLRALHARFPIVTLVFEVSD